MVRGISVLQRGRQFLEELVRDEGWMPEFDRLFGGFFDVDFHLTEEFISAHGFEDLAFFYFYIMFLVKTESPLLYEVVDCRVLALGSLKLTLPHLCYFISRIFQKLCGLYGLVILLLLASYPLSVPYVFDDLQNMLMPLTPLELQGRVGFCIVVIYRIILHIFLRIGNMDDMTLLALIHLVV